MTFLIPPVFFSFIETCDRNVAPKVLKWICYQITCPETNGRRGKNDATGLDYILSENWLEMMKFWL